MRLKTLPTVAILAVLATLASMLLLYLLVVENKAHDETWRLYSKAAEEFAALKNEQYKPGDSKKLSECLSDASLLRKALADDYRQKCQEAGGDTLSCIPTKYEQELWAGQQQRLADECYELFGGG